MHFKFSSAFSYYEQEMHFGFFSFLFSHISLPPSSSVRHCVGEYNSLLNNIYLFIIILLNTGHYKNYNRVKVIGNLVFRRCF